MKDHGDTVSNLLNDRFTTNGLMLQLRYLPFE